MATINGNKMQKCSFQSALIEQTNTQLHLSRNTYRERWCSISVPLPWNVPQQRRLFSIDLGIFNKNLYSEKTYFKMFSFSINKKFCMQGTDYKTGLAWSDLTKNRLLNGKYTCLKLTTERSPFIFMPLVSVVQSTGSV